ncbi:ammonium transporter Rh type A isoform X2 [Prorops nasuta]
MLSVCGQKQPVLALFTIQIVLIGLMSSFMTYGPEAQPIDKKSSSSHNKEPEKDALRIYPMYQDVHVMIWIGFGFLMTFLKRYGQSAVGLTFLIGAILVQVALVCEGLLSFKIGAKAYLSLEGLLSADVAVAAPLISMGALLGKTTYMQLVFMGILELIVYTGNKYVGEHHLMAVDAGDSMYVHAFGAYFGLAVSFVLGYKDKSTTKDHPLEGSSYDSDIFAMIGTIFLWLFWPSFNSAALMGDEQQRAIINTLLSISASCVIAFATSALLSKDYKFNMVHVQNSTLSGGVAIGTAAAMKCEPIGALVIGSIAGFLSVLGYKYLTPMIQKRLRIHDTCGVHNLHGMPGVLAGIFGALMAGIATEASYNDSLVKIFPARAPSLAVKDSEVPLGLDRTAGQQAAYQMLALAVTLCVAIVTGLITGSILRLSVCGSISEENKFDDTVNWDLESEISESPLRNKDENIPDQVQLGHI